MSTILVVGDSYANGRGCSDTVHGDQTPSKHCWAALLQKKITCSTLKNLALPGSDNITIARSVWDNIDSTVSTIMFCGTFMSRAQVKNPQDDSKTESILANYHKKNLSEFKEYYAAVGNYYRYLYSDRVGENISVAALMSAYACATQLNAKFYWSLPYGHEMVNHPALSLIKHCQITACGDLDYSPTELAACGHPNDAGHMRYFREVIDPLF